MREEAHGGLGEVRRPERRGAVGVSKVEDRGEGVLREGVAGAEPRAVFADDLTRGCVLVFEESGISLGKM